LWRISAVYSEILHKVREESILKNGRVLNKRNKTRTKVKILGQDYVVKGAYSGEKIKEMADYVDNLMEETRRRFPNLPLNKLAILTSLNLAEELFRVKNDYELLLRTLEEEQKKK
jgi:cell division protein ZapA